MYFQGNNRNRVFSRTVWTAIFFYVHVARNEMDGIPIGYFSRVLYTRAHTTFY